MTTTQGAAARQLLSYVAALPLASPDAQLLAVVVAIRSARGGAGNVSGQDLRSLRLTDPGEAVAALDELGWGVPGELVDGPPEIPRPVTVPALVFGPDHPLPFGKGKRSRVSGWIIRTLASKPLRKAGPAARLAALYLAAHSSPRLDGTVPTDLPEAGRAALPELLERMFLAELDGDRYLLDEKVQHLSGLLPGPDDVTEPEKSARPVPPEVTPGDWEEWKAAARPGLRRHAEVVETCALCSLPFVRVATAFTFRQPALPSPRSVLDKYAAWQEKHPDRGEQAARFTIEFRAEHGHGPSYGQLCAGLRWKARRRVRSLIVGELLADGWLTSTSPVPWTLRPGATANAHGIVLPGAR
ncbi:hypothetical protein LG634_09325 [Streptomyces bambusae]|uniref:hypothetical protein n=1 Tax=Streptomyces bambusae TaxID=1550616 RepID=UPI001CFEE182|nr:hypothetical protein [Streptomyces bambusae]MCB5165027.1 hypothetical protein [Streptomyces bambusae]